MLIEVEGKVADCGDAPLVPPSISVPSFKFGTEGRRISDQILTAISNSFVINSAYSVTPARICCVTLAIRGEFGVQNHLSFLLTFIS